ncbi:MAG: dihydrofolate reductase family protein [Propionicimonas sp.]
MARTVFYTATTLDGFIATHDHSLDWLVSRVPGKDGPLDYAAFIAGIGSLCMGANTYEWLYRACHDPDGAETQTWAYTQPCWVFSHRALSAWPGAPVTTTAAPVPEVYAELVAAAGDRDVWVVGGGDLAGQFLDHGLLDEVIVNIAPVTLGSGQPLLPRRAELRCLETMTSGEFIAARYEVVR